MTGHDLGYVSVDWGGRHLRLRYPIGAVREIQQVLGKSREIHECALLHGELGLDNLALFLWAGLLHEHPPGSGTEPESLADLKAWSDWVPSEGILLISVAIQRAFLLGTRGSAPEIALPKAGASQTRTQTETSPSPGAGRVRSALRWLAAVFRRVSFGGGGPWRTSRPTSSPTPNANV